MTPTIEKLRHLWRNRTSVFAANPLLAVRVDKVYEIVDGWENQEDNIEAMTMLQSPKDMVIPINNWPQVKDNFLTKYEGPNRELFPDLLKKVEGLLHIVTEKSEFRISSNAASGSPHETNNTNKVQMNPEAYYASYNWPFEIVKYYLSLRHDNNATPLRQCLVEKFVLKFLWMLANRKQVVPILSLQSYYDLAPLFSRVQPNFPQVTEGRWALPLDAFIDQWNQVSSELSEQITDQPYGQLEDGDKKEFAKLLFIASLTKTTTKNALDMVKTGCQAIILYGPPGTGKTHQAQEVVRELLKGVELGKCKFARHFPEGCEPLAVAKPPPGYWALIQFHPTYSYHDFIGGIIPKLAGDALGYVRHEGIFKRFCDKAKEKEHQDKSFVLIIDEINRAELSAVLGELMYAIEYRGEEVSIPHFGPFVIPKNVYIIGTMNSADKSLVTFDLALRRRFLFFRLMPDMSVLVDWNAKQTPPIHKDDLRLLIDRAEQLNKAVVGKAESNALGLPEDNCIGQAYFMKIRDFCLADEEGSEPSRITEFSREQLWTYHLEPLLEEYLGAEAESRKADLMKLRDDFIKGA